MFTDPLEQRLAERLAELIDIASPSGSEGELTAYLLNLFGDRARDGGDGCVLVGSCERSTRPLILLAGHLDTVPAQGNQSSRLADGVIYGLGAADMKGALAVMIELALRPPQRPTVDFGCVFFPREELPFADTALTPLLERERGLRTADLAVVMEPTSNRIQLGCLGNLNATWTFEGLAAHSARPWLGDNAIHSSAQGLAAVAELPVVEHTFAGLSFREVTSVTTISGGVARNVIPDRCVAHVNHRYPPGRSAAAAEAALHAHLDPYGSLTIDGNAPSGAVPCDNRLIERLRTLAGGAAVEPKQAWTPVAEFALVGVDAVNFGPGDPAFAHRRDEQVTAAALAASLRTLERLLCD